MFPRPDTPLTNGVHGLGKIAMWRERTSMNTTLPVERLFAARFYFGLPC